MPTNYEKYIMSTGTHYISNSGSDERGQYHGGAAGDQTGKEWQLRGWYKRPWTCVLRWPDPAVGLKIAALGIDAALNDNIGYDQWQRRTYWDALQKAGYDPSKIKTKCEEDCTAGVTANVKAVGFLLGIKALQNIEIDTYSTNMRARFVKAGFVALTGSKYINYDTYLLPGDILLCENHHAATNITYGKSVRPSKMPAIPGTAAEGLRRGNKGEDVRAMQRMLLIWKADCLPKWGADGDFGSETEKALKAFQKADGLPVTGVYDEATEKALKAVGGQKCVTVTGNTVNVRAAPNINGRIIGTAHKGDKLPYGGETQTDDRGIPWYLVDHKNENGWISGNVSRLAN